MIRSSLASTPRLSSQKITWIGRSSAHLDDLLQTKLPAGTPNNQIGKFCITFAITLDHSRACTPVAVRKASLQTPDS